MPTRNETRLGLLVVRASVEQPSQRLVVQVLEVNPSRPDRVLGVMHSSQAAARLVEQWLDSQVALS